MPEKLTPKNNSEHFIELANKRVPKALKALELVGNLGNKSNYTYSKSQSDQIKKHCETKLMKCAENLIVKLGKKMIFNSNK